MATDLGSVISLAPEGALSIVSIIIWIAIVGGSALGLLGLAWWIYSSRKRWNLKVEIKLPRSDGALIFGEWGKGFYDSKRGVVYIKRPGSKRKYPMRVFDVRKYMQGTDVITVIQAGPEDFRPVLARSYSYHFQKDKEGKDVIKDGRPQMEAIMNMETEPGKTKAWRVAFEEASKQAYTIKSMLQQYSTPISIGIVLIASFVGFAILWSKLGSIC